MERLKSLLVGVSSLVVGVLFLSLAVATGQQAPQYPLDEKLSNEPAPWTVPGKWGERGNWSRWGEEDKRGMLNYITPEMIVNAAGLVKQGKVYAHRCPLKPMSRLIPLLLPLDYQATRCSTPPKRFHQWPKRC